MDRVVHKKDMIPGSGTYLHLDYRMSGVGSKSCGGDDPQLQCRINAAEEFDFTIKIERTSNHSKEAKKVSPMTPSKSFQQRF